MAPAPVLRVPLLDADVHDLGGLEMVAESLFGPNDLPRTEQRPESTSWAADDRCI